MKTSKSRLFYVLSLSKYIHNYKGKIAGSIMVHGLYKLMPIVIGFTTAWMIGKAVAGELEHPARFFLFVLFMVIGNAFLNYFDIVVSHDMAYRILTELRNVSYEKLAAIAPAALQGEESGNIMSVVLEDIEILEWFYAHTINQVIISIVLPILGMVVLGMFSLWIPLLLFVFICMLLWVPYKMKEKSNAQGAKVQEKLGNLNSCIIDGIQGIADIITFQWQGHYFKRVFARNDDYHAALRCYALRSAEEMQAMNFIMGVSSLASTLLIIFLCLQGKFGVVWILPLLSLSTLIYAPLQETLTMSTNYGRIFAASERVFTLLQRQSVVRDQGTLDWQDLKQGKERGIRFEGIEFSYPTTEENGQCLTICKGLSFRAPENKTTVLVGESGSGKSTCIKLLQRFWDPEKGKICIHGVDSKEMALTELRKSITMVPQDIYLFNMSIEENLRLANLSASKEKIIEALKKANAYDFISEFPQGIQTLVGERGMRLSGGEKQRIAIAQAFLKDSPILILDEASANLDSQNEKIINEAIEKLKKGRTTLMIAHRLSTIQSGDRLVLIKEGRVEAEGRYEEVWSQSSYFRQLVGSEYEF